MLLQYQFFKRINLRNKLSILFYCINLLYLNMRVIIITIYLLVITVVKADFGKRFEEKDPKNDNIMAKDGELIIYPRIRNLKA